MIPADINGLTFARTPQMVRRNPSMRAQLAESTLLWLLLLLFAACGCC